MKKIILLAALVVAGAAILYFLTKPPAREGINEDFTRIYRGVTAVRDTAAVFPFRIDVLATWNDRIVWYGMKSRSIGLLDTAGGISHSLAYEPADPIASTIHSISVTPDSVYCFDLNGHVAGKTDFIHGLHFADSLRTETRAIVVNPSKGFSFLHFNRDSSRLFLYDSLPAQPPVILFAFEIMGDRGFSHWANMVKDETGRNLFCVPFYNSRIIRYDYVSRQLSFIETIERTPVRDHGVSGGGTAILSSKTPAINRKACSDGKKLYVVSYARSRTDDPGVEIVDVYDLDRNAYRSSFVLPGFAKGKVNAMTCIHNKLAVSNGTSIILYTLYENHQP